jgi:hypothetical protein
MTSCIQQVKKLKQQIRNNPSLPSVKTPNAMTDEIGSTLST